MSERDEGYKERGYVRLWRGFQDDPLYKKRRRFSQWEAWLHLYIEASGMDRVIEFQRARINVRRGQLVTTFRILAKRWQWSLNSVRNFLGKLQRRNTIDLKSLKAGCRGHIIITLKNYERLNQNE